MEALPPAQPTLFFLLFFFLSSFPLSSSSSSDLLWNNNGNLERSFSPVVSASAAATAAQTGQIEAATAAGAAVAAGAAAAQDGVENVDAPPKFVEVTKSKVYSYNNNDFWLVSRIASLGKVVASSGRILYHFSVRGSPQNFCATPKMREEKLPSYRNSL